MKICGTEDPVDNGTLPAVALASDLLLGEAPVAQDVSAENGRAEAATGEVFGAEVQATEAPAIEVPAA